MDKLNRTRLSDAYGIDQETLDAIRKTLDENTLYGLDDDQLAQAIVYAQMYDAPVEKAIALIDYLQDMDPPVIGTETAHEFALLFLGHRLSIQSIGLLIGTASRHGIALSQLSKAQLDLFISQCRTHGYRLSEEITKSILEGD